MVRKGQKAAHLLYNIPTGSTTVITPWVPISAHVKAGACNAKRHIAVYFDDAQNAHVTWVAATQESLEAPSPAVGEGKGCRANTTGGFGEIRRDYAEKALTKMHPIFTKSLSQGGQVNRTPYLRLGLSLFRCVGFDFVPCGDTGASCQSGAWNWSDPQQAPR